MYTHMVNSVCIACPVMVNGYIDLLHCCGLPLGAAHALDRDYILLNVMGEDKTHIYL